MLDGFDIFPFLIFVFLIIFLFGLISGIISILRLFFPQASNSASQSQKQIFSRVVRDLQNLLAKPDILRKDITQLRDTYLREIGEYGLQPQEETMQAGITKEPQVESAKSFDISTVFSAWYRKNTINFLLYLGAFLIVVACATFLSFTWNSLSGMTRFLSFTMVTAAFGIVGYAFSRKEKIADAGFVFIGIMALLLPLNGIAYQNFVLLPNASFTGTWIATSVICLFLYALLFIYLPNRFYAVILNLSSLSLVESFINLTANNNAYYIFGGIIISFLMFFAHRLFKQKQYKQVQPVFDQGSQVVLGISMLAGIWYLTIQGNIFTLEASIALLLAGIYYAIRYWYGEKMYFIVSDIFFFAAVYIFSQYTQTAPITTVVSMLCFSFANIALALYWKQFTSFVFEYSSSLYASLAYASLAMLFAATNITEGSLVTLIAALWTLTFLIAYVIDKKEAYMYLFFIAYSVFLPYLNINYLQSLFPGIPTISFSFLLSTACVLFRFNESRRLRLPYLFAMSLFTFCSFVVLINEPDQLYITLVSYFTLLLSAYATTKISDDLIVFVPNLFLYVFVFFLLSYLKNTDYILFWLTLTAGAGYTFGIVLESLPANTKRGEYTSNFALAVSFVCSAITTVVPENQYTLLTLSHVLCVVLTAGYLTHYWDKKKMPHFGYFASFVWIVALVKLFQYIGITNWNAYYQPFAYYFIGCGMYQHIKGIPTARNLLLAGLIASITPFFFQSFGTDGILYAVYLTAESLAFIAIGISLNYQELRYAGLAGVTLALFAQTSQFIFSLPRWLLIGILGLIIITAGTYLLGKRNKAVD